MRSDLAAPGVTPRLAGLGGLLVLCGIVAGALVMTDRLGHRWQAILAVGFALALLGLALFAWRPALAVNGYVFVIPFLISPASGGSVNPGIVLTLAIMMVGVPGLLLGRHAIPREVRSLVWPLVGLGLLGIVSCFANSITSIADISNAVVKYFSFALVALLIYVHNNRRDHIEFLMKALVAAAIIIAGYSIFMYASGRSFYPQYGYSRASGTFENWNELGGYMALLAFPTALLAAASRRPVVRRLLIGACGLQLVALLLSLTLGAVLGVAVSCVAATFIFARRRIAIVVLGILLGGFVLLLVRHFDPALAQKFSASNARVQDRFATYSVGLEAVRHHLWWGAGSETQVLQSVITTPTQQPVSVVPHNAFIAIGVEKGIFGAILLGIFVINALRILMRPSRQYGQFRLWHYGLLLGACAFLIQNMSNLLMLHSRLGMVWLAILVLDVRLKQLNEAEPLVHEPM